MKLTELVKAWRYRNELSLREAAEIIGVSYVSLQRFEQGETESGPTLLAILKWAMSDA